MANTLTGTWGSATFGPPAMSSLPQTTTKECFDMGPKLMAAEMENNKFAKFVNHFEEYWPVSAKTREHVSFALEKCLMVTRGMLRSPRSGGDADTADRFLTVQQPYGVGDKSQASRVNETGEIAAAMGRSGARVERGLKGSGLSGEVLNTSVEPSQNTFVQRMWMYQDDSALYYRQNGVPESDQQDGLSLRIGENQEAALTKKSKMRSSTDLMFNPIKKTGYKIFQDDENAEDANLEYHYKY